MKIEQDGPLSWLVESDSDPGVVHCVIFHKGPRAKATVYCSCRDFECRHGPRLRAGGSMRANACKHIKAVAEHIKWLAIERMVEMFDEGKIT